MIYLDNAATSFPKPPPVTEAITVFLRTSAANPGRSAHALAVSAQRQVEGCRRRVAQLFGVPDPSRIVFTLNATDAINIGLKGVVSPGDHIVSTEMEHNSVARPLRRLQSEGVEVTHAPAGTDGTISPDDVRAALRPETRLVVFSNASNVTGTIQPLEDIAAAARQRGALVMVDAAQAAGSIPLDLSSLPIDLMACSGHKGLLGPTGTGVLYVGEGAEVRSLREGGTGSQSESDEQPTHLPDRLESGTVNTVGLAGLGAAAQFIADQGGVEHIRKHELALCEQLWAGLSAVEDVTLYGPAAAERRSSVVSLNITGWEPVDVAAVLDASFGIAVRAGLHCAPLAHRSIGTFPRGTVRMSPGYFSTTDDIAAAIDAVRTIAGEP